MKLRTVIPIETFFDQDLLTEIWPEAIVRNDDFKRQIDRRMKLRSNLHDIVSRLPRPDISLRSAIDEGYVTEEQITDLYISLAELLKVPEYGRLILYLPFGFLPDKEWYRRTDDLGQASLRFADSYIKVWKNMLHTHDIRANFLDGDVLELSRRTHDPQRVVKAMHLLPELIERDMLRILEIILLTEESDDQILKESFIDVFPLLSGCDRKIVPGTQYEEDTIPIIIDDLRRSFHETAEEPGDITEKRKVWLKHRRTREVIETAGERIGAVMIDHPLSDDEITLFSSPEEKQSLIEGIREAAESVAKTDLTQSRRIYDRYSDVIISLWNDEALTDNISKIYRRLNHLTVVRSEELEELGITTSDLAGPFSKNLQEMKNEKNAVRELITAINEDAELRTKVHPLVILFGSRLKGYGERNADVDMGVFVKPGTDISKRHELRIKLQGIIHRTVMKGELVDFWLDDNLRPIDYDERDPSLGKNHWVHILFGAAWTGEESIIKDLCPKILLPYMCADGEILEREARGLYLEVMEQDNLQYRLMHSGYERFFAPRGGRYSGDEAIGGDSMFWDPGYRQLATKLYVDRVFLPKLSTSFRERTRPSL